MQIITIIWVMFIIQLNFMQKRSKATKSNTYPYQRALNLNYNNSEYHNNLGVVYRKNMNYELAI